MASTTSHKLQNILDCKEAIRTAIDDMGVSCGKTVPFSRYAEKIRQIQQGGGLGMVISGIILPISTGLYSGQKLTIQDQPVDYIGAVDESAFFVVIAVGVGISYQWQWCVAGGDSWSDSGQDGNATSILRVPITAARDGQMYRCVVSDSGGNQLTSNTATLIVG